MTNTNVSFIQTKVTAFSMTKLLNYGLYNPSVVFCVFCQSLSKRLVQNCCLMIINAKAVDNQFFAKQKQTFKNLYIAELQYFLAD